jgi:DNA-binding NtrC family response regulator
VAGPEILATGTLETILLVEDEEPLRRLIGKTLTSRGYTVLSAPSAEDALELTARHQGKIDLLLSDVVLPNLSGPALAQRLVPRYPAMRVLFISGYVSVETSARMLSSPNASLLPKPFKLDELLMAVRRRIDQRVDRVADAWR